MQHSERKIQSRRAELDQAVAQFADMYNITQMVEMIGQLHTSALADECTDTLERQSRAHFITHSSKVLAALMALYESERTTVENPDVHHIDCMMH